MPDHFPQAIQDLISRMLTVDPNHRIKIEQIKQHPAFRMFLPDTYIPPTPFKIIQLPDPIDPSEIDPNVVEILLHIGYESKEEVTKELTSEQHTMAQVFYRMYNHQFSLETLPWNNNNDVHSSSSELLSTTESAFEMSPMPEAMLAVNPNQNDPFHRRSKIQVPDVSSPDVYSLAHKMSWSGVTTGFSFQEDGSFQTEKFENIPTPIENLFDQLFKILAENQCEYLHPDELTVYARKNDCGLYLIFNAIFESIERFTLVMKRATNQGLNEFLSIYSDLSSMLNQAASNDEFK